MAMAIMTLYSSRVLLTGILMLVCIGLVLSFTVGPSISRLSRRLAAASWDEIEASFGSTFSSPVPVSIDSVLQPSKPFFSTERPTLFRERHGWCPYSERVWLTLELKGISYDTVRIDNTGGPRPSYFSGTTPQLKWPDGRVQGESLDLVRDLDATYSDRPPLLFPPESLDEIEYCISQFRSIFPSGARPSSRAAFLFQGNGDPLWRGVFEDTLKGTNELLGKNRDGPFFCGDAITGADVAWVPFLERYRYQLPCLHEGLEPNDANKYPHLAAWYAAMDRVPAYACRVKGDASSWRKVLLMAGFGNAFVPPNIEANIDELAQEEALAAQSTIDQHLWSEYASTRPYLADTPQGQAALVITRNREAISVDTLKRTDSSMWSDWGLPNDESDLDEAIRELVQALIGDSEAKATSRAGALASFLDERMCVPRDMGAMSAAAIKHCVCVPSVDRG